MKIVVSGGSGLIGSAVCAALEARGDQIVRLVRDRNKVSAEGRRFWDPQKGIIEPEAFRGVDAVIHLAGENIAGSRWSARKKEKILTSRVRSTSLIAKTLRETADPPRTFLCASAVGFYGDRGPEVLDETSGWGTGFLAEVCRQWEETAAQARDAAVRVVSLRFGMVLAAEGGALAAMLPVFRLGLGAKLGSGCQYQSWISLEDAVRAILFCLDQHSLSGPVNVVSPNPVTNSEFTISLAKALKRPAIFRVPAFVLKAALGQMADELLLASCRAVPGKLRENGFGFNHPTLIEALEAGRREKARSPKAGN
ncbi:MAG: TIGR01777 family oxidoreductase [Candidatus Glassbacteria bacterium]